jgi:dihydrofolate synthase/folylpolyglutamate synthase
MTQLAQQLDYLAGLRRFETIKLGLQAMTALMEALGNPHHTFDSIHIAGTNGKGSTAALLASALRQLYVPTTKKKVALYTSPYIRTFNERIQVNGRPVSNQKLASLIAEVRIAAEEHGLNPTYFEFATALAFLHFAREQVETAVIEVGMGGLLDATNVITPRVSVITNIGLDHMEWLGTTKREIAHNKAGIIKKGVAVVTAEKDPRVLSLLQHVAQRHGSTFYAVESHLTATVAKRSLAAQTFTTNGTVNDSFRLRLLGEHQVTNACTALLALYALRQSQKPKRGLSAKDLRAIKQAFARTYVPGRLDILSRKPFILADGAHNGDGIRALARSLDNYPFPAPDTLLVGAKRDKDTRALVKHIVPRFRRIIVTEANFQPMPADKLAAQIKKHHADVRAITPVHKALQAAQANLAPGSMLLITGSLYLVSDALHALRST